MDAQADLSLCLAHVRRYVFSCWSSDLQCMKSPGHNMPYTKNEGQDTACAFAQCNIRFNPKSANHNNCRLLCHLLVILKVIRTNSVDPDQTAPLGAV